MHRASGCTGISIILLFAGGCGGHKVVWNADPSQPLIYSIERQKKFINGAFQETDHLELTFRFSANRQASIGITGSPPANVTLAADGAVSPSDTEIPLIATILALSSPDDGGGRQVGGKWTVRNPRDSALKDNELSLQLEHTVELAGMSQAGGSNILELKVTGMRRLVENSRSKQLLGSGAAAGAAGALYKWLPYLAGTVWWNEGLGAPERADLRLVAGPIPVASPADIATTPGQNHLVIERKP